MNKRKGKIIIANFKMNFNMNYELQHWFTNFSKAKKSVHIDSARIVLCPPAIHLSTFIKKIKSKTIFFGAQDCFWDAKGAFTGETSPVSIKSVGGEYVILGHSERRRYKGETNKVVNYKIIAALKAGLSPIVCIGENAMEKKNDLILSVITKQFNECFQDVSRSKMDKIIICYEPVWAISANKPDHPPSTNEIMGARLLIKKLLTQKYGPAITERVSIIYGGSVVSKNVQEVCVDSGMEGALVGGASLLPHDFMKIVEGLDS